MRDKLGASIPGMAHFAGTGPAGKFCGNCAYWVPRKGGSGESKRCGKYTELMGQEGPTHISPWTRACRYFIEARYQRADEPTK